MAEHEDATTELAPVARSKDDVGLPFVILAGGALAVWLVLFSRLAWHIAHQQPPNIEYLYFGGLHFLYSAGLVLVYIIMSILPRFRRQLLRPLPLVAMGLLGVALLLFSDPTGRVFLLREEARIAGLRHAARAGAPLVEAIQRYQRDHGKPPEDLKALVPEYIPAIPRTGIWISPNYRYSRYKDPQAWELGVHCPRGMIDFSEYRYSHPPVEFIPSRSHAAQVGGWIYERD
jgi:hypothetical protein